MYKCYIFNKKTGKILITSSGDDYSVLSEWGKKCEKEDKKCTYLIIKMN